MVVHLKYINDKIQLGSSAQHSHLIGNVVHCIGASIARQHLTDLHNLLGFVLLSFLLLLLGGGDHVWDLSYQWNCLYKQQLY